MTTRDTDAEARIHIATQAAGKRTAELTCNWCGLPHLVESSYHFDMIERGKKLIGEAKAASKNGDPVINITPEETWTCGRCMLYHCALPLDAMKTECSDHDVPETRHGKKE